MAQYGLVEIAQTCHLEDTGPNPSSTTNHSPLSLSLLCDKLGRIILANLNTLEQDHIGSKGISKLCLAGQSEGVLLF